MIELLNMDCMDYMREQPDKSFDLAIVDPPYGIGAGKGTRVINRNKTWINAEDNGKVLTGDWDKNKPSSEYFEQLIRVSKEQIIWGGNYFEQLESNNNWIIWDKKITNHTFSPFEMAWSSSGKCKIFRYLLEGYKSENPREMQQRTHPTQKPIKLYDWLLRNYSEPGQRNLDTHLGSGSSAIAAHYFGVDFVGIEIDEDYYNAAKQRFDKETAQVALF